MNWTYWSNISQVDISHVTACESPQKHVFLIESGNFLKILQIRSFDVNYMWMSVYHIVSNKSE